MAGRESEIQMGPSVRCPLFGTFLGAADKHVEVRELVRLIVAMKMQDLRPGVVRRPPVEVVNNPISGLQRPQSLSTEVLRFCGEPCDRISDRIRGITGESSVKFL